jgi:hypothetical protein
LIALFHIEIHMRFQVPQFIEVEDKIFGPLTLKQFIYLAGGGAAVFLIWRYTPFLVSVLLTIPLASLSAALAFYKVNNKPFINVIEAAYHYTLSSKLYIWKKEPKPMVKKQSQPRDPSMLYIPKLTDSKLKDLTWSLGVKKNVESTNTENELPEK